MITEDSRYGQIGTRIKAIGTRESDTWGVRVFEYRGEVMERRQLLPTWHERDREYNVGTMVLSLNANGNELNGVTTYVDQDREKVVSEERTYTKTPAA